MDAKAFKRTSNHDGMHTSRLDNQISKLYSAVGPLFDNLNSEQINEWLTTEEAAEYLRVSVGSLRNMSSSGQVPYYKLCGRNRYRRSELRLLFLKKEKGT